MCPQTMELSFKRKRILTPLCAFPIWYSSWLNSAGMALSACESDRKSVWGPSLLGLHFCHVQLD